MPDAMIILNTILIDTVVIAIVGLCAWGIVTDKPFVTYRVNRAIARRRRAYARGRPLP